MPVVTLIGYRGTGKTTAGRLLAGRLAVPWLDADAVLEERVGCTITSLVRDRGEAAFRDAETEALADILAGFNGVLATGGGVVLREMNRRLLLELGRPIVWLTAPIDTIRRRLAADPATHDRRPALRGGDPLAEIEGTVREREPLYRACADLTIDSGDTTPAEVANRIAIWLGQRSGSIDLGGTES